MNNGLYHIEDNKIYKMSLNEPMKQVGTVASDEAIMNIIDRHSAHSINAALLRVSLLIYIIYTSRHLAHSPNQNGYEM